MSEWLPALFAAYLAAVNLAAFCAMGIDKARAKKAARRISEAALFLLAVAGGSPGAIIAMHAFRHKTRHPKFRFGLPAVLLIQIALTFLILSL